MTSIETSFGILQGIPNMNFFEGDPGTAMTPEEELSNLEGKLSAERTKRQNDINGKIDELFKLPEERSAGDGGEASVQTEVQNPLYTLLSMYQPKAPRDMVAVPKIDNLEIKKIFSAGDLESGQKIISTSIFIPEDPKWNEKMPNYFLNLMKSIEVFSERIQPGNFKYRVYIDGYLYDAVMGSDDSYLNLFMYCLFEDIESHSYLINTALKTTSKQKSEMQEKVDYYNSFGENYKHFFNFFKFIRTYIERITANVGGKYNHVQIFTYKAESIVKQPALIEGEDIFHLGHPSTFGSIVRLLPLLDEKVDLFFSVNSSCCLTDVTSKIINQFAEQDEYDMYGVNYNRFNSFKKVDLAFSMLDENLQALQKSLEKVELYGDANGLFDTPNYSIALGFFGMKTQKFPGLKDRFAKEMNKILRGAATLPHVIKKNLFGYGFDEVLWCHCIYSDKTLVDENLYIFNPEPHYKEINFSKDGDTGKALFCLKSSLHSRMGGLYYIKGDGTENKATNPDHGESFSNIISENVDSYWTYDGDCFGRKSDTGEISGKRISGKPEEDYQPQYLEVGPNEGDGPRVFSIKGRDKLYSKFGVGYNFLNDVVGDDSTTYKSNFFQIITKDKKLGLISFFGDIIHCFDERRKLFLTTSKRLDHRQIHTKLKRLSKSKEKIIAEEWPTEFLRLQYAGKWIGHPENDLEKIALGIQPEIERMKQLLCRLNDIDEVLLTENTDVGKIVDYFGTLNKEYKKLFELKNNTFIPKSYTFAGDHLDALKLHYSYPNNCQINKKPYLFVVVEEDPKGTKGGGRKILSKRRRKYIKNKKKKLRTRKNKKNRK